MKSFNDSVELQNEMQEQLLKEEGSFLAGKIFGLEHPTVITLGKRGSLSLDVNVSEEEIQVVEIDRGGQATLHSPGQLVIYPILNLRRLNLGVREYVETLEKVTIHSLKQLGIAAERGHQPGVFTPNGKIAFVGVRIRRGISSHGISINFSNDLNLFQNIRSCGVQNASFDRVYNYHTDFKIHDFFENWQNLFRQAIKLE